MSKCCVSDCDAPGIVSADHPDASLYCEDHSACRGCGESVAGFIFDEILSIWLCPCVQSRQRAIPREDEQAVLDVPAEKKVQFGDTIPRQKKKSA